MMQCVCNTGLLNDKGTEMFEVWGVMQTLVLKSASAVKAKHSNTTELDPYCKAQW